MKLCLDTNIFRAISNQNQQILEILSSSTEILLPFIVVAELQSGFKNPNRFKENNLRLETFIKKNNIQILHSTLTNFCVYACSIRITPYFCSRIKDHGRNNKINWQILDLLRRIISDYDRYDHLGQFMVLGRLALRAYLLSTGTRRYVVRSTTGCHFKHILYCLYKARSILYNTIRVKIVIIYRLKLT